MSTQRYFSGARWEEIVGYCRALRIGNLVFVTGTAPIAADGSVHAPGNPYAQAQRCFAIISEALAALGAGVQHVVRTRLFVTDIRMWEAFGRAHREFVGDHRPCTTMVEVRALIDPAMLIEVEVDAVVDLERASRA